MTATEKFEKNIERLPFSGCWIWLGALNPGGYGHAYVHGFAERHAHRLAWLLFNGPIPAGIYVLHRCDIRCCVNPHHLFLGTSADNTQDMMAKGRDGHNPDMRGSRNPNAKLTREQVEVIRNSSLSGLKLARQFNISSTMVYFIKNGRNWNNIGETQ